MQKIKLFLESEKEKDILVVLIVILMSLASFELGRLSKENAQNDLKIESSQQKANNSLNSQNSANLVISEINSKDSNEKGFFASKKGKKYYSVDCSAGKTIKEENKVYFSTGDEAEKAGYALSSICQ